MKIYSEIEVENNVVAISYRSVVISRRDLEHGRVLGGILGYGPEVRFVLEARRVLVSDHADLHRCVLGAGKRRRAQIVGRNTYLRLKRKLFV